MRANLYWVSGSWSGRLAILPRPRGGDWLEDEIQSWRQAGIDIAVSLLMPDEIADLELANEAAACQANGIQFMSLPITDRGVPSSRTGFGKLVKMLAEQLGQGKNVAVHCRQGIGRAALVAICLLILAGNEPNAAVEQVGAARGCPVPETTEQRRWIDDFAKSFMAQPT